MKNGMPRKGNSEQGQSPWVKCRFLLVVVSLYAIFFLVAPEKTAIAFSFGLKVLAKIWLVLIFVFFLIFIVNLLVKPSWIKKHLGHDSGLKGLLVALVSGIISMGPIYIWYGLLDDFHKKGMRPALMAIFLYGRGIKIPLLPLLAFYFGTPYTVVLTGYMVIFAVLSGLWTEWLVLGGKSSR